MSLVLNYYPMVEDKISFIVLSIIKNHCFANGNKRTAVIIFSILCRSNNIKITSDDILFDIILKTATSKFDVQKFKTKIFRNPSMLNYNEWFIAESFDIKPIDSPKISSKTVRDMMIDALVKNGYSVDIANNGINSLFDKTSSLYGYKKEIDNVTYLVIHYSKGGYKEVHFFDLDNMTATGEDLGKIISSQKLFSFVMNVIFSLMTGSNLIKIVYPKQNDRRYQLYKKMINKVFEKHKESYPAYTVVEKVDSFILKTNSSKFDFLNT